MGTKINRYAWWGSFSGRDEIIVDEILPTPTHARKRWADSERSSPCLHSPEWGATTTDRHVIIQKGNVAFNTVDSLPSNGKKATVVQQTAQRVSAGIVWHSGRYRDSVGCKAGSRMAFFCCHCHLRWILLESIEGTVIVCDWVEEVCGLLATNMNKKNTPF